MSKYIKHIINHIPLRPPSLWQRKRLIKKKIYLMFVIGFSSVMTDGAFFLAGCVVGQEAGDGTRHLFSRQVAADIWWISGGLRRLSGLDQGS